jgi:flagella basal body P-ring formation protein FlgA
VICAAPAFADSVVTTRPILANTAVTAQDVTLVAMAIPNALDDLALAIGHETRVAISAGRAITAGDVRPSSQIARNARITLVFALGGLEIITEGRALSAGGIGQIIDAMNLSSRARVRGRIGQGGVVHVDTGQ